MKRLRILVVEDDYMIAFLLGEILKGMGHDVCASEGTEDGAIAAALRCKPDLMIVDEHLGAGSGLNVVDVVLGNGPVPHLFVSGDVKKIERLRPHDVIMEKPYSEADLARAIHKAMNPGSGPALGQLARSTMSKIPASRPSAFAHDKESRGVVTEVAGIHPTLLPNSA